ncbi:hypothetical protein ACHMW7_05665 [Aminobacter sp. UC22_36]|uniref:hypothetical protein n=1 Tax=Aminobacter sp. UC22_36 TaxID=3374549 RepID=UPI0037583F06
MEQKALRLLSPITSSPAFSSMPLSGLFWAEPMPLRSVTPTRGHEFERKKMKHSLATAVLLASTTLAAPAIAEDAARPAAQVDTSTTASTSATADLGTVLSAIQASSSTARAIQAMTTVGSVQIVTLSEIAKGDKQALDKAVSDNEADITGVQAAIMANSALKSQLDAEMVETSAIVAASIGADGSVTVFVR